MICLDDGLVSKLDADDAGPGGDHGAEHYFLGVPAVGGTDAVRVPDAPVETERRPCTRGGVDTSGLVARVDITRAGIQET